MKEIICFTCDEVFKAEGYKWLDPNGKLHELYPMLCQQCGERSKIPKATERPRTPVRLPYPDDDEEKS